MAINKFVDRQGNTLLDLSADSVTSENFVLAGKTYHGPDGVQHTGTLNPGPMDYSQYNFIDYDGTLLHSYTDAQLDALTALPAGPDHTDENLTFQSWNWSLADLKAWDRTRADRPLVGANYITTDGKSYLYMDTPYAGATLSFSKYGTLNSVDWGDGTVDTNTSHVYALPGQYVIAIDMAEGEDQYFSFEANPTKSTNHQWIKKIKLGNVKKLGYNQYCYSLETISLPNNLGLLGGSLFYYGYRLKNISIPNGVTSIGSSLFYYCCSLKNISIPKGVTDIGPTSFFYNNLESITIPDSVTSIKNTAFQGCNNLKSITISDSITSIGENAFRECRSLKSITIPDSVTSIGANAFNSCYSLTLDLTKQTKVITLSSNIGLDTTNNKILVPAALLSDYKSANYWKNYASIMVGV